MKLSIIIPTLNEEKVLENLLIQLTDKKLKDKFDFEIIVSDGGSKDDTLKIAKKYTDKIILCNSVQNQNIAIGRNIGASIAKGELLCFINADIKLPNPEELFDDLIHCFEKDYVAYTCSVKIDPDQEILSDKIFLNFYNYYFHFLNIINVGMGRGECQVIKKSIFDETHGYNENLAAGEDFELFKRIRKIGKIYFSHRVKVFESPRRYRKYGHILIFLSWLLNSIFVIFKKKSYSKKWEEVR